MTEEPRDLARSNIRALAERCGMEGEARISAILLIEQTLHDGLEAIRLVLANPPYSCTLPPPGNHTVTFAPVGPSPIAGVDVHTREKLQGEEPHDHS